MWSSSLQVATALARACVALVWLSAAVIAQFPGNVVQEHSHTPIPYPFMALSSNVYVLRGQTQVSPSTGAYLVWADNTLHRFTNNTTQACSVLMSASNLGVSSTAYHLNFAMFESDTSIIAAVHIDGTRTLIVRVIYDPVANTLRCAVRFLPVFVRSCSLAHRVCMFSGRRFRLLLHSRFLTISWCFSRTSSVAFCLRCLITLACSCSPFACSTFSSRFAFLFCYVCAFLLSLNQILLALAQLHQNWLYDPRYSMWGIEGHICPFSNTRFFISVLNFSSPVAYASILGLDVANLTQPYIFMHQFPPFPFLDFESPCAFDATRSVVYFPLYRNAADIIHVIGRFLLTNNGNTPLQLTGLLDFNKPGMLTQVPTYSLGYPASFLLDSTLQLLFLFNKDTVYPIDLVSFTPLFTHGVKTSVSWQDLGLSGSLDTQHSVLVYIASDLRNATLGAATTSVSVLSYANIYCPPGLLPTNSCLACPTGMGVFKQPWGELCLWFGFSVCAGC